MDDSLQLRWYCNLPAKPTPPQVHVPFGCLPLTYKYCIFRGDDTFELEIGENRLVPGKWFIYL